MPDTRILEARMRKVTAGLFHSVDGVVQDPFKFQFDSFDEDLGKGLTRMINTEKFVASRTLSEPLEWENSRLIDGPLEDFITGLKARDGGEIAVCGSISVTRQLLFAGLLDELTLMTHPVVAGSGRRLFEDGDPLTRLVLKDQYRTSKGNVVSTYSMRAD
jgi:dihydrofolate reductase